MKKQLHILGGILILVFILVAGLFTIKFIYNIKHEKLDTSYMWNINFTNLQVSEGSKEGNITLDNNKLNLEVTLEKEEEYYEFTIDVENKGTLDAKISKLDIDIDNPKDILKYEINYSDGMSIDVGDKLLSSETKTIKVKIYYPKQDNKIYEALKLKLSLNIEYTTL